MAHEKNTRKKGGVGKILLVLVVLLALAVGGALLFAHNEISGNGRPGTEVTVSIPQGSGVSVIAQKLKDAGVIRSAYLFRWYVGQKGAASKLQYGDFTLQKSACSYDAIIAVLSTYAKAETVRVTIPEGTTAIAIAQKMEAAGLCSAEDFLKEANEGDFSEYTFWQYVPDDADAPPAQDTPPVAESEAPVGFWSDLVAAVRKELKPPISGFFVVTPNAPVQGALVGDRLELRCSNGFTAQMLDRPEILEVVSRKAAAMLSRPVKAVTVDMSEKPAANPRMEQLMNFGRAHSDIVTIKR